jgi:hypothetical protein
MTIIILVEYCYYYLFMFINRNNLRKNVLEIILNIKKGNTIKFQNDLFKGLKY